MSENFIPRELVVDILVRLPVKTLLRCMSVCKLWKSTIADPNFITSHSRRRDDGETTTSSYLIRDEKKTFSVYSREVIDNQQSLMFEKQAQIGLPFSSRSSIRIINSINGVMCLYNRRKDSRLVHRSYLYNPSIRKLVTLPRPTFIIDSSHSKPFRVDGVVGFGFDEGNGDYKVIRILYVWIPNYLRPSLHRRISKTAELYSLRAGAWKRIDDAPFRGYVDFQDDQAFFEGSIHWIAFRTHGPIANLTSHFFLQLFDVSNETFREMELPLYVRPSSVFKLKEWISVVKYGIEATTFGIAYKYKIWIMKEYGVAESWTVLYNLKTSYDLARTRIIGFKDKDYLLLLARAYCGSNSNQGPAWSASLRPVLYHPQTGQTTDTVTGIPNDINPFYSYMTPYVENLFLLC